MKFINVESAPDIPDEILQAQESGRLIFFCGAGISVAAGLPDFCGLVENTYKELQTNMEKKEREAIKSGNYIEALQLLENRISGNLVRKAIIKILSIKFGADLAAHLAILALSKTSEYKHRLVTTNLDLAFKKAMPGLLIESAPHLPIPKLQEWQSVVHLHGIVDKKNNPDGKNLIFTTADFGMAYLTDGFASKFIIELFKNYTVLFVGYSMKDPFIFHMTEAITREKQKGNTEFHQLYIMTLIEEDKDDKKDRWEDKGVKPILYSGHKHLQDTLKEWANYYKNGLKGKINIILSSLYQTPLSSYEVDRVICMLKIDPSGVCAKEFFRNKKAPIDWLPILRQKELLFVSKPQEMLYPVVNHTELNLKQPNETTRNLWLWLTQHLEEDHLVEWAIEQGGYLHPLFKDFINRALEKDDSRPKEPYLKFWRLIVSDKIINNSVINSASAYTLVTSLKQFDDELQMNHFVALLEPKFQLTRALIEPNKIDISDREKKLFEAKVVINFSKFEYDELKKLKGYPEKFINLLPKITELLNDALKMWGFVGCANDCVSRGLASISPHPQNQYFYSWVILIEICRDLWGAAYSLNCPLAFSILEIWKSHNCPTFRRLVLHAYTCQPEADGEKALEYLLEQGGQWLWDRSIRREKFRLLAHIWPKLPKTAAEKLLNTILQGPPHQNRSNLSDEHWFEYSDYNIWLLLAKLKSFGRDLNSPAELKFTALSQKYPNWALQGEQDEFSSWHETRDRNETDVATEKLFSLPVNVLVAKLLEDNPKYNAGRIDVFRQGCMENYQKASEVLVYLKNKNIWHEKIWHAALSGLTDSKDPSWNLVAPLLQEASIDFFTKEAWVIAWWAKRAVRDVPVSSDEEQPFWKIIENLLRAANSPELNQKSDFFNTAINSPIGIITEALLDRFYQLKLKAGQGIPSINYLVCINKIIYGKGDSFLLGRVILASRLGYLYFVDPQWAKTQFLPKFNWDSSNEAIVLWHGYLWPSPKISINLALELKSEIMTALIEDKKIPGCLETLHQLFAFICLEYSDLYNSDEKYQILRSIRKEGLKNIAKFLFLSVKSINQNNISAYWKNRLKPFVQKWPKDKCLMSAEISEYLVLMAVNLGKAFPDALEIIKPVLMPFNNLSLFLMKLRNTNLLDEQPEKLFELLALVFTPQYQGSIECLRDILNQLSEKAPKIKNHPKFKLMTDDLLRKT